MTAREGMVGDDALADLTFEEQTRVPDITGQRLLFQETP